MEGTIKTKLKNIEIGDIVTYLPNTIEINDLLSKISMSKNKLSYFSEGMKFKNTEKFNLNNSLLLAIASDLAYEDSEDKIRKELSKINFKLIAKVHENVKDGDLFLAEDEENLWVISRGTEPTSIEDWMTDLKFRESNIKKVRFHQGFHISAQALLNTKVGSKKLIDLIDELSDKKKHVYFSGHSLGGALAVYFSWYLSKIYDNNGDEKVPIIDEKKVVTYTFGAPNVGNEELSNEIKENTFRIVYNQDIVARVPNFLNYKPAGKLYYIDEDGDISNPLDIPRIEEIIINNLTDFKTNLDLSVILKFGIFTPFVKFFLNHSMEYYCYFLKKASEQKNS